MASEPMAIMTQHHMEDKTYDISIRAKCIFKDLTI